MWCQQIEGMHLDYANQNHRWDADFLYHQILVPFLYHQICSSFWTKHVAKRPLNHQFSAYITKILWTKEESMKCSENNKQIKTKKKKEGKEARQQQLVVHQL